MDDMDILWGADMRALTDLIRDLTTVYQNAPSELAYRYAVISLLTKGDDINPQPTNEGIFHIYYKQHVFGPAEDPDPDELDDSWVR